MVHHIFTRRRFVHHAALTAGSLAVTRSLNAQTGPAVQSAPAQTAPALPQATLTLGTGAPGPKVPLDFIGLSYETMQLEDASFFSQDNISLVQQFRVLSPRGVLRLGGATSESGWWMATPTESAPARPTPARPDQGETAAGTTFAITPQAIDNLDGFLRATGWGCIYGLNLAYATPEACMAEATYVFNKLGPRLQYFQLGHEVDSLAGRLRPKGWGAAAYLQEWLAVARAIQKALPQAKFGLPDAASPMAWPSQIAALWDRVDDKPTVVALTHHYYWTGPPSNPGITLDHLLTPDPRIAAQATAIRTAATAMGGKAYRMTEGNTVDHGGTPGISDVLAAALWSAGYVLQLMSLGYSGVNLHGGAGHAQAVALGGTLDGEALMKDTSAPHPKPFSTPIANDGTLAGAGLDGKLSASYVLEPAGQGMKFAAAFAGTTMLPVEFNTGGANAVAYAARRADGKTIVAILNKEATQGILVTAPFFDTTLILSGSALDAHDARVNTVVRETSSRRTAAGQQFILPPHMATLIVLA